jgi:hypothetical protein
MRCTLTTESPSSERPSENRRTIQDSLATAGGAPCPWTKQLVVYLPNGQKIAEASYAEKDTNNATIMTAKDGKQTTITINPTKAPRKQVIDWLVDNNYL